MISATKLAVCAGAAAMLLAIPALTQQQGNSPGEKPKLYNTAKAKLLEGKQVFSHTVSRLNVEGYCEDIKHYDFTWFEMQHSTMSWADVESMIAECGNKGATPMVRMPDAFESSIQKATDIGALGIIVPTVDDALEARDAARYSRFPPIGRRSSGAGQAGRIWGQFGNYRQTVDENMLVVVMIETVEGVNNVLEIASVPGIDVVITGNNDLSSFSGYKQNDPKYQELLERVRDGTLKAGKIFGTAAATYAKGNPVSKDAFFFQNGPSNDGYTPARRGGGGRGRAPGAPGGPGARNGRGGQGAQQ